MAIHSCGQMIFSLTHIKGITESAGEEVDEVTGGVSSMDVDRIGDAYDRASEVQTSWVYGTGFTVGSMTWVGARDGT